MAKKAQRKRPRLVYRPKPEPVAPIAHATGESRAQAGELQMLTTQLGLVLAAAIGRLENVHRDIEACNPRVFPIKAQTKMQWSREIGYVIADAKRAIDTIPQVYPAVA